MRGLISGFVRSPTGGGLVQSGQLAWPLLAPDGSAGAPSYSFKDDPDTGWYRGTSGGWTNFAVLAVGGNGVFGCNASLAEFNVTPRPSGNNTIDFGQSGRSWDDGYLNRILAGDGAAGTPSLTFQSDTDTGLFLAGAANPRIVAAGATVLNMTSAVVDFYKQPRPNAIDTLDNGSDTLRWKRIFASGVVHEFGEHNGNYTVDVADFAIRENSAGAFTHTLPSGPPNGTTYIFWANGDSALTIAAGTGDTIGGAANHTVQLNTATLVIYDKANLDWRYIDLGSAG